MESSEDGPDLNKGYIRRLITNVTNKCNWERKIGAPKTLCCFLGNSLSNAECQPARALVLYRLYGERRRTLIPKARLSHQGESTNSASKRRGHGRPWNGLSQPIVGSKWNYKPMAESDAASLFQDYKFVQTGEVQGGDRSIKTLDVPRISKRTYALLRVIPIPIDSVHDSN